MDVHFLCLIRGNLRNHSLALLCRSGGWASNFIWLKDTLVGCGTAAEGSDLNSLSCGNSVPNQF